MSKQAVFTMKLESELREAREYDAFLRGKVEAGRVAMQAGQGRSNEDVEAEFAARRVAVASRR